MQSERNSALVPIVASLDGDQTRTHDFFSLIRRILEEYTHYCPTCPGLVPIALGSCLVRRGPGEQDKVFPSNHPSPGGGKKTQESCAEAEGGSRRATTESCGLRSPTERNTQVDDATGRMFPYPATSPPRRQSVEWPTHTLGAAEDD